MFLLAEYNRPKHNKTVTLTISVYTEYVVLLLKLVEYHPDFKYTIFQDSKMAAAVMSLRCSREKRWFRIGLLAVQYGFFYFHQEFHSFLLEVLHVTVQLVCVDACERRE